MSLDSAKLGDSSLHQDTQKAPAFSLPACPPPRWSDFYQIPIENDIIDGTDWIDFLWEVLHRATPPTYRASKSFAFTFRRLGEHVTDFHISKLSLIWFLTNSIRTKTLHAIYDILEHWGYLESACPGLIDDILQEIKVNASDTMTFSVDLRHRCQTAGLELDHKMRMLQAIVNRQHRDFNPKNLLKTIAYLICGALAIFALVLVPLLPWVSSESPIDTWLPYIGLIGLHMIPTASRAYSPALDIAYRIDDLNTKTFQLIWAVRDVAGLLTLISESESSPLSDVLHAERFLKAFQTSVCYVPLISFCRSFE
ncbi:uncharacterized protein EV420DRAFT_862221 [Desarmillaria tabescens]|uniref:Uncharacterized protein n=1 Tax=Armillaria tabescens TaxID=1929756 RepID=A0AA39JS05_ARMTA|nr:uncharacterized protein EV420DRAFT_862221 [Desarmillaria tabescens]KAK0447847.1 hypothetical protein EV420DRAFT_862221 [Desarmillaria tabescens]